MEWTESVNLVLCLSRAQDFLPRITKEIPGLYSSQRVNDRLNTTAAPRKRLTDLIAGCSVKLFG